MDDNWPGRRIVATATVVILETAIEGELEIRNERISQPTGQETNSNYHLAYADRRAKKKETPRILPSVAALTSLGLCRLFRLGNGIAKDTTELTFSGCRAAIVPVIGPPSLSAAIPVYVEIRSDVSPALRVSSPALTWHRRGTCLLSVAAVVKPPSRVIRKLSIRTRAEIPSSRVSDRNHETVLWRFDRPRTKRE